MGFDLFFLILYLSVSLELYQQQRKDHKSMIAPSFNIYFFLFSIQMKLVKKNIESSPATQQITLSNVFFALSFVPNDYFMFIIYCYFTLGLVFAILFFIIASTGMETQQYRWNAREIMDNKLFCTMKTIFFLFLLNWCAVTFSEATTTGKITSIIYRPHRHNSGHE